MYTYMTLFLEILDKKVLVPIPSKYQIFYIV
jgi:hypothetical protein